MLLITGIIIFVIAAFSSIYFMFGYSAMLEDIDAQYYEIKGKVMSL